MINKKQKTNKFTVLELLGAMSYWGSASRLLLLGVPLAFAYILNLSTAETWQQIDQELLFLIYGLGTLLILDVGYVTAARELTIKKNSHFTFDKAILLLSDAVVAGFFIVPSLFFHHLNDKMRILSLIIALIIIFVRMLVGLLYSKRRRRWR